MKSSKLLHRILHVLSVVLLSFAMNIAFTDASLAAWGASKKDLAKRGAISLENLDQIHNGKRENICALGINLNRTNFVTGYYLSPPPTQIKLGDKILSMNGFSAENVNAMVASIAVLSPGDPVKVTVERNGGELEIEANCLDATEYFQKWRKVFEAQKNKDPKKCLEELNSGLVDGSLTRSTSYLSEQLVCTEASFSSRKVPGHWYWVQVLNVWTAQIDDHSYNLQDLEGLRGNITSIATYFVDYRFYEFAAELQNYYADALEVTSSTTTNAQTKFGFEGNEFDSLVVAYGNGELSNFEDTDTILYGLDIWKNVKSQNIMYRISFTVFYTGDWRRYSAATKKGGDNLNFIEIDKDVVTCVGDSDCVLSESFNVILTKEEFLAGIPFQVKGGGYSFIFDVSEEDAARVQTIADENFPRF